MMHRPSRRHFIKTTALTAGFLGLQAYITGCQSSGSRAATGPSHATVPGFGPLLDDPNGLLRLPRGFSYTSFSKRGELMDDGFFVPGAHDGMDAFAGPEGTTILVRNHEMSPGDPLNGPFRKNPALFRRATEASLFDPARGSQLCLGGTTTLVYDTASQTLKQHSLSLAGTVRNCAGGRTPWGSWITCEETVITKDELFEHDHGYCFEVPASAEMKLADATPLRELGRFNHEAVAVDPASGVVYLTEDRPDGLIYRFIPRTPGNLREGGKLQAMALRDQPSGDTRNWSGTGGKPFPLNQPVAVSWIDLEDIQAPQDDLRYRGFEGGAARFARGEGMFYDQGTVYFACTNGGPRQFGQIFKYRPSPFEGQSTEDSEPGELELFIESLDSELLRACDNLTVAPWGDVILCEDDGDHSAIVGVTPEGELYHLAHVGYNSELAGSCFSPDGTTLFVNLQWDPGQTLAITGPWSTRQA